MKNIKLLLCLTALACVFFTNCENPIIEKWWQEPDIEYEPIVKMVPQVTRETVYETIYEQVVQYVPQYIYETITKIEYQTVYQEVIKEVPTDPTPDQIKEYIRDHFDEVIKIINNSPDKEEIIKEIIKSIPPDEIEKYLTVEQIKYILEQQPPQIILQTITIIDIEYIIFAGSSSVYNGAPAAGANTSLTAEEKSSNDKSVAAIAKALKDHPDYLIMLHGHANPTTLDNPDEIGDLMTLSMDRAKAVEAELRTQFKKNNSNVDIENSRVSTSGYGGEKVLFSSNSAYTALNRRVEMILIRVGVEQ